MTTVANKWNFGNGNHTLNERPSIVNVVNGERRYYSSLDAELFFGDIFISDITDIVWSIEQKSMPIFGYNSYTFDDIAVGSRMVQGQFTMNFHSKGFLEALQCDSKFISIARKLYGEEDRKDSSFTSDYRKRLNLPIWDKGFDIVVAYGSHGKSINNLNDNVIATHLIIECCQITGSNTLLSSQGLPVQETYSFIARDLRYAHEEDRTEVDTDTGESIVTDDTISARFEVFDGNTVTIAATIEQPIDVTKNSTFYIKTPFKNKAINSEYSFTFELSDNTYSYTFEPSTSKAIIAEIKAEELEDIDVVFNLFYTTNDVSKHLKDIEITLDTE